MLPKEKLDKISKISDIPNFPFKSFEEIGESVDKNEVRIGLAMDISRQWLTGGHKSAPTFHAIIVTLLGLSAILYLVFLIFFSIFTFNFWYLFLIPLVIISFFILPPMMMRAFGGISHLLLLIGFGLLVFGFISDSKAAIISGLSIVIPWLGHKLSYVISINIATGKVLEDEDLFILFVKSNAVNFVFTDTGETIWPWDLLEGKMPQRHEAQKYTEPVSSPDLIGDDPQSSLYCTNCGVRLTSDARFCEACGTKAE